MANMCELESKIRRELADEANQMTWSEDVLFDKILAGIAGAKTRNRAGIIKWVLPAAAVVIAGAILVAFLTNGAGLGHRDVAYAMQQAVSQLSSYHGVLEIRTVNAAGKVVDSEREEIWWEQGKDATRDDGGWFDGILTVNNGQLFWQVRPQEKVVEVIASPPLRVAQTTDDLGNLRYESERALRYPHAVVGTEVIAGRQTQKLQISPPGGLSYFLWIDTATNLPMQLQSAVMGTMMGCGLQTTSTFLSFEPNARIDPAIFTYDLPEGYRVINDDQKQLMTTVQRAAAVSGLTPLLPTQKPNRIFAYRGHVILDYGDVVISETAAPPRPLRGGFFDGPAYDGALLGTAAGGLLEVIPEANFRWRQQGIDVEVEGSQTEQMVALAREITPDLTLPDPNADLVGQAKVNLPEDLPGARADQLLVGQNFVASDETVPYDVAFTFVNSKLSPPGTFSVLKPSDCTWNGTGIPPKGWSGTPKIPYTSFNLVADNGVEAVVAVADGQIRQVYLKRLVRQDDTGVWSVVGYDPR